MKRTLVIEIHSRDGKAKFSGQGTYTAKDVIKSLGRALWDHSRKEWTVFDFRKSEAELRELFAEYELKINHVGETLGRGGSLVELWAGGGNQDVQVSALENLTSGLSVGELVREIDLTLQQHFSTSVFVYGVIDSVKRKAGRTFISLSDPEQRDTSISCVIWNGEEELTRGLADAGFSLEPDLQVMFRVEVRVAKNDARVRLTIREVVAEYTVGKLAAERELTNRRLMKEGIFDLNKRLEFPLLPIRIGVLTSASGTVINDFRTAIERVRFGFELYWMHVGVQGAKAKREIVFGLREIVRRVQLDIVVLIRGGGSPADLSIFNDYEIAREICLCPVPVLSAIGHEVDQSSAQDVSFRAFGVPKDVGHYLSEVINDIRTRYRESVCQIVRAGREQLDFENRRLERLATGFLGDGRRIIGAERRHLDAVARGLPPLTCGVITRDRERMYSRGTLFVAVARRQTLLLRTASGGVWKQIVFQMRSAFERCEKRLEVCGREVMREVTRIVEALQSRVSGFESQFRDLSPEVQLQRGFALVHRRNDSRDDGAIVTRSVDLAAGEPIEIEFQDGRRGAVIE